MKKVIVISMVIIVLSMVLSSGGCKTEQKERGKEAGVEKVQQKVVF